MKKIFIARIFRFYALHEKVLLSRSAQFMNGSHFTALRPRAGQVALGEFRLRSFRG
jgi:hypothetical protein